MTKAYISEIQQFCVHDGPGIRTTVFFQGCTLKCKWCQNPETISMTPVIMYDKDLCSGCGACIDSCPRKAICVDNEKGPVTDTNKCELCGECEKECFFLARKLSSRLYDVEEVFGKVIKDEVVFKNSGGGVTVSGGEPLLHKDFVAELLSKCKESGISTAVETAGFIPWENIEAVYRHVDTFLFDLKLYSRDKHIEWVGADNSLIKDNLRKLTDIHDNVVIRIPLIQGVNDSDDEFGKMMAFVKSLRKINSVHLLPFHQFGSNKYELMGKKYEMIDWPDDNEDGVERCKKIAADYGFRVCVGGTGFKTDRRVKEREENILAESFIYK